MRLQNVFDGRVNLRGNGLLKLRDRRQRDGGARCW